MQLSQRHQEYWKKNLVMTTVLMVIWVFVTFVIGYYARDVFSFNFFGWPFAFWIGAQGGLAIYVVLIGVYAWYMGKLDKEYDVEEGDE